MTDLVVVDAVHDPFDEVYRLTIGYVQTTTTADGDEVSELVPVEVFVFSATDDRWQGKKPDDVVKEQRRLVRAALREREDAVTPRPVETLPGVGDPL